MEIDVKGPIISDGDQWIYDYFGMPATSPSKISKSLAEANGKDVTISINSGGGSVFSASEIYTSLKEYKGNITGKIVGLAASAASVIAMGCKNLKMSPTAQMMIHNATTRASGDNRVMDSTSQLLTNANETIAKAYSAKCGKDMKDLLSMMDAETWMTATKAKELNLIDEVMFEQNEGQSLVASAYDSVIPQEVINKIMNSAVNCGVKNKESEVSQKMDVEKIKNEHPEIYNQIFNLGKTAENNRIKEIEELGAVGFDDLINKAKFETMDSCEKVAINIIKAQKELGNTFMKNAEEDAAEINDIQPGSAENNADKEESMAKFMADIVNNGRGVK